ERNRTFDSNQAIDGLRQILWGLFKKIVIADNCAPFTNQIFNNYASYSSSSLLLGAFLYTIQLYADFSGYSDMAIGISRLLGFNIARNFDFPFFAQNIAEFWRKWHMSLTSWLTDYVFTPLSIAFRDYGKAGLIFAIVINFTICGIWHGANWTYVLFGFLHGCYFIPLIVKGTMNKRKKIATGKLLPSFGELINVLATFTLVMFTFIIFRSESLQQAYHFIHNIFTRSLFTTPDIMPWYILLFIVFFLTVEWSGRDYEFAIAYMGLKLNTQIRWGIYLVFSVLILYFNFYNTKTDFIYFQF
ncbi:MAG TPA: MBOAT family O-acyltransferase, partial [Puia sp.]|nr:MBOAT family O-acyltransferase [Puia sp.]